LDYPCQTEAVVSLPFLFQVVIATVWFARAAMLDDNTNDITEVFL
jgi:hypothetical protein